MFTVTFDNDRKVWVVDCDDPAFEPETFDNVQDAEQFAADMRRCAEPYSTRRYYA